LAVTLKDTKVYCFVLVSSVLLEKNPETHQEESTYLVGNENISKDAKSTNENKSCVEAICLSSVLSS